MLLMMLLFAAGMTCLPAAVLAGPSLNHTSVNLWVGQEIQLKTGSSSGSTKWRSSNKKVASVDKNGWVRGLKKGSARITAKVKGKQLSCHVTVTSNLARKALKKARRVVSKPLSITSRPGRVLYYTNVPRIDYLAEALIREMGITGKMSDEAIIKKIYSYMSSHFYYGKDQSGASMYPYNYYDSAVLEDKISAFGELVRQGIAQGKIQEEDKYTLAQYYTHDGQVKSFIFDDISWVINGREGVCDNHAAVFSVLCGHMGIKAGIAGGTISGNSHAWSWAMVKGKKYYYDIGTSIHSYFHNKTVSYACYKMKKSKMKRYRFTDER